YLRTPCFSKPSKSASDNVSSATFGKPADNAASTPPALATARARARMSAKALAFLVSSIRSFPKHRRDEIGRDGASDSNVSSVCCLLPPPSGSAPSVECQTPRSCGDVQDPVPTSAVQYRRAYPAFLPLPDRPALY